MPAVTDVLPESLLDDRREESSDVRRSIVAAAIGAFRTTAFHQVSLEAVALRAGVAVEEVRTHFPVLEDLHFGVLRAWYAEHMAPVTPADPAQGTVAFLRSIVAANVADPALMRFLAALVNVAATPEHPLGSFLQQQWLHFHARVHRGLVADVARGEEVPGMDPARGAEQLMALYEGLQLQSMVRPAMNLLGSFDRGVETLRDGWAHHRAATLWEI